jgi:hypothetical protein
MLVKTSGSNNTHDVRPDAWTSQTPGLKPGRYTYEARGVATRNVI